MHRRFSAVLLAAGLLGALGAGPALATTKPVRHVTCGAPSLSKAAAPAIGASATYPAGSAGSVVVNRADAANLQVASATAKGGWTDQVLPGGLHAKVRFTNAGTHSIVRFQATLSRNGSQIHVRVTTCQ
jgi:hypothetical protein